MAARPFAGRLPDPVPGLWHTGAGAHPLGTLNGWSGRTTARELLRAGA